MSGPSTSDQRSQTPHAPGPRAQLLDDEGAVTPRFEQVLLEIFKKYATKQDSANDSADSYAMLAEGLAQFGRDTNGAPLPEDQLEEIKTFLDCDDQGNLLFKGFIQMYSLQTSSDLDETWKDLHAHGYNDVSYFKTFSGTAAMRPCPT